MSELFDGTECIHDLTHETCSICREAGKPPVYISAGGSRYHLRRDCSSLQSGQATVDARGGEVAPVTIARLGTADVEGRDACKTCWT